MRQQFEYKSLYISGFDGDDQENITPEFINILLKEHTRIYNRLGGEGWLLIAEHMEIHTYSAIATFRRVNEAGTDPASEAHPAMSPAGPARQAESYPTLQPDPAAPDTFRLVWEK